VAETEGVERQAAWVIRLGAGNRNRTWPCRIIACAAIRAISASCRH